MFGYIWHTFFFDPVYNGLIYFINVVPGGDVGLAIVATTIVVKLVLLPLSLKAARTQRVMRTLEEPLKALKEKYQDNKDKREEQAREMMALYREAGVNPFASILLMFIQIPIIIALYFAVFSGGGVQLPGINTDLLYSFVPSPEAINVMFLGLMDITAKSLPLAALAGITQYFHARLSIPAPTPAEPGAKPDFKTDFTRIMQTQMRYVLPLVIFFVAYTISAAIALYFVVSNVVNILQELVVKRD